MRSPLLFVIGLSIALPSFASAGKGPAPATASQGNRATDSSDGPRAPDLLRRRINGWRAYRVARAAVRRDEVLKAAMKRRRDGGVEMAQVAGSAMLGVLVPSLALVASGVATISGGTAGLAVLGSGALAAATLPRLLAVRDRKATVEDHWDRLTPQERAILAAAKWTPSFSSNSSPTSSSVSSQARKGNP
jgi:hypothetical protein